MQCWEALLIFEKNIYRVIRVIFAPPFFTFPEFENMVFAMTLEAKNDVHIPTKSPKFTYVRVKIIVLVKMIFDDDYCNDNLAPIHKTLLQ